MEETYSENKKEIPVTDMKIGFFEKVWRLIEFIITYPTFFYLLHIFTELKVENNFITLALGGYLITLIISKIRRFIKIPRVIYYLLLFFVTILSSEVKSQIKLRNTTHDVIIEDMPIIIKKEWYELDEVKVKNITVKDGKLIVSHDELIDIEDLKSEIFSGRIYSSYPNGIISQMYFRNEENIFQFLEFYTDGNIKTIADTDKGMILGSFEQFYPNGNLAIEYTKSYNSEQNNFGLEGISKTFYQNGTLKELFNHKNGKLLGKFKKFNQNGEISSFGEVTSDRYLEYDRENNLILDSNIIPVFKVNFL